MARGDYIIVQEIRPRRRHHRDHEHSSSSGHHHSSHSRSSRHEPSHSSHRGEEDSRDHNVRPWSSSANQFPGPNVTPRYTHSQYYSPPVSSRYPQYQYQQEPITVYRREGEGVHYVESRSGGYGGSYGPSGSSYFPSTRETSTWETGYRNGEASYSTGPRPPHDTVNEPANNVPLPIQQAITRGEEAMKTLRDTIRVVLLHEWCMSNGEIYPPDDDFKTAIKVIPVQRHKHGALQPIESTRSKWGVKTGYHPEYDIYLPTILIRVPPELRVSEAKIKAAYKRLFAEARNELLEDVLEIPFKDNQDWRTYGMLFTFDRGRKYRLFDDYLCEDAVIRLRA